jgi:hypothetical protein
VNSCSICHLPVLEIDGQFENLEPYYADPDHEAAELGGECHSSCISANEHGRTWYEWRVRSYSTGRGYRLVAEEEGWSVLIHTRHPGLLAFHASGFSVASEPPSRSGHGTPTDGGMLVPVVDQEFNLRLDDVDIVATVKAGLKQQGHYPILSMLSLLGIADRIKWPQALENAAFVFDKKLQRDWGDTDLAMRARYHKFLPELVVPFWKSLK